MGNVRGKSARRASMGEAETISRLGRVLSKVLDHTRVAGRRSVALTQLPSLLMVSDAQHDSL